MFFFFAVFMPGKPHSWPANAGHRVATWLFSSLCCPFCLVYAPNKTFTMSDSTLPSIATILQSTDVLSAPDASATVVRVGEKFAVKHGAQVAIETTAMSQFLRHMAH